MEDKCIIEGGHRLTDKHINFASYLIFRQFPQIGGLRTTLLQTRYYCFPSQSIQAIFCKRREHWIVASNIGTRPYMCHNYNEKHAEAKWVNWLWFVCYCCDDIISTQRRPKHSHV